jgi:Leucine-rich repeat (LRR) protein
MTRLKYLRIEGQNITELFEEMRCLTDLRTLSLDNNKFRQIPSSVLYYSKIYSLSLRQNQL